MSRNLQSSDAGTAALLIDMAVSRLLSPSPQNHEGTKDQNDIKRCHKSEGLKHWSMADSKHTNNAEHGSKYEVEESISIVAERPYASWPLRSHYRARAEVVLPEWWTRPAKIATATELRLVTTRVSPLHSIVCLPSVATGFARPHFHVPREDPNLPEF